MVERVAGEIEQGLARPSRILMEIQFHADGTTSYICSALYILDCADCGINCGESKEPREVTLCSECR